VEHLWQEIAGLIVLIMVLFLFPYEKAVYQVDFDFDASDRVDRLCRSGSQS
jgi:hypothetical protein